MKVLQINSICGGGSTGKIMVQISDYLNTCGIENYIAYGLGKTNRKNAFRIGNMIDAHLHSFISRKFCMQGCASHFTTWRLVRYMCKIKPDIVHLHNIHGHYLNYEILFKCFDKLNCQVVWTLHDCWPFTGKCAHYLSAGCMKWETGCYDCPQLNSYPDSVVDRSRKNYEIKKRLFTQSPHLTVVTVSHWLQTQVERSFLKEKPVETVYNGIDTCTFKWKGNTWKKERKLEDKFVILGVASVWSNQKGFKDFLKLSEFLDDNMQIVLVGITEEQNKSLPANIIGLPGTRDQAQLADIYSAADVFVHLSLEETFGLVIAEALACGTPAIVYDASACPEVLGEGCGFVVKAGDIQEVHNKIKEIYLNGKKYYTQRASAYAQEHFAQEIMLKKYLKLYQKLYVGCENN